MLMSTIINVIIITMIVMPRQVCLPKGQGSLNIHVGNYLGHAVITGFRAGPGGTRHYAERCGRIKPGDVIVAVNGVYVHRTRFEHITRLVKTTAPYVYLRLLRFAPGQNRKPDFIDKYFDDKENRVSFH